MITSARSLNVELIDRKIVELGWTYKRAAEELDIDYKTLKRIYERKNVHNDVIVKIQQKLDIPLGVLIVWHPNGDSVSTR